MSKSKKYSKKKHLPLKINKYETWVNNHKQQERRYYNTDQNWKQNLSNMSAEEVFNAMFTYAHEGNKKMLKWLFESSEFADLDARDLDNNSPIMYAVGSGKTEAVDYLLSQDVIVDYTNQLGFSPLHLAVRKNALKITEQLLKYGAVIDIQDAYRQTPLFDAVQENNTTMIEFLIENGANINHKNKEGRTPLMVASYNRHRQEAMCSLIHMGADVNATDNMGRDAFMHAINNNNGAMMDILLKAGANINHRDTEGYTPLMICAKRGNREGLRVLIARGADVFCVNEQGKSAYDIAVLCENPTCAEILKKAEKIYSTPMSDVDRKKLLKEFATHNRMVNSCIR